jgi:hypothetical protein
MTLFEYINGFYNLHRRHSMLGGKNPHKNKAKDRGEVSVERRRVEN